MSRGYFSDQDLRLEDFVSLLNDPVHLADYPNAASVEQGALVYEAPALRQRLVDGHTERRAVCSEISRALLAGPGVVVFRRALEPGPIERVSTVFRDIITEQRRVSGSKGDHFGVPGANDRIWNALEKLALIDPDAFVAYYSNDMVALGAEAWLGPMYQMTSQVNVVNPGGAAQMPHRDFHLGFMTDETAAQFPSHAHALSPVLTLQGAIAHTDMPLETGPTMYLPHSQKFQPGYLAWRRHEFIEYFNEHHVQVPLSVGDLVYFNPALFHGAGTNVTADVFRMANLLQINSAFGRAMESVDRLRMSLAVYPALLAAKRDGTSTADIEAAVASCAEGYAFPTNLDRDQPVGRLTPHSQAELLLGALADELDEAALDELLHAHSVRQQTS